MKNDYYKSSFWTIKDENDVIHFYLRVNRQWIEVEKTIFSICKSSYQKMYRDSFKEEDKVLWYSDIDQINFDTDNEYEKNLIHSIYKKDQIIKLQKALFELSSDDKNIIISLFFEEMSYRELALILGIPTTTLHNRTKKILKKIKEKMEQ